MHIPVSEELLCGFTRSSNAEQLPVGPVVVRYVVVEESDPRSFGKYKIIFPKVSSVKIMHGLQNDLGVNGLELLGIPTLNPFLPCASRGLFSVGPQSIRLGMLQRQDLRPLVKD